VPPSGMRPTATRETAKRETATRETAKRGRGAWLLVPAQDLLSVGVSQPV
jgi:hypothetical protein